MRNAFLEAFKPRRTQYALGRNVPLSHARITELVKEAVRLAPSTFNSQSSRVVLLFGAQSETLWSAVAQALRKVTPAEAFPRTEAKMRAFAAGVGTVLFFEDQDVVKGLQEKYPLYAENFPLWSEQSSGMAQVAVWAALANDGVGASLQHYNPLIDEQIAQTWGIPASWKLRAQMPFGSNEAPIGEKTFMDDAQRFLVFE